MSLVIIVICIILSGFFSATETAYSSLNRIRIKNMAEKGNKRAQLVLDQVEDYNSILSTILIGNNIVNILCASVATILFVELLQLILLLNVVFIFIKLKKAMFN